MGSKSNPGKFDCFSKAEPDEPVFVLLGRDPVASVVVQIWAALRERLDSEDPKCDEALACSVAMTEWAASKGKVEDIQRAREAHRADINEQHNARIDRLSERVREIEKERDEDRDRYETAVGHVRTLEALCRSAADAIMMQIAVNEDDGGMRGRQELEALVKELRAV